MRGLHAAGTRPATQLPASVLTSLLLRVNAARQTWDMSPVGVRLLAAAGPADLPADAVSLVRGALSTFFDRNVRAGLSCAFKETREPY